MSSGRWMFLHVTVELVCKACGKDLDRAIQHRGQHPRASESYLDGRGAQLVDAPGGRRKVVAVCRGCGAKPQVRWDRVVAELDSLDENGEHTTSFRI